MKWSGFLVVVCSSFLMGCSNSGGSSNSAVLTDETGEFALFQADDGVSGSELFRSDGTEAGTIQVKDINIGGGGSSPSVITRFGPTQSVEMLGSLYFTADDGVNGEELWKTDGTEEGTVLVKDINPAGSSRPSRLTVFNDTLYFSADEDGDFFDDGLWKSDGTEAGTEKINITLPFGGVPSAVTVVASNNLNVFFTLDNIGKHELWASNGTELGTGLVKVIGDNSNFHTVMNNKLYFQGDDGTNGEELWVSDGTEAGTFMLKDIRANSPSSTPVSLTVLDINATTSNLFFVADDGVSGSELWVSDGTAAGTKIVSDIWVGGTGSNPTNLTVFDGELYFSATDGLSGIELWKTLGGANAVELVKDINPGIDGGSVNQFFPTDKGLLFNANNGVDGVELWISDGTENGTLLLKDINESGSSFPQAKAIVNDNILVIADDGVNGYEMWVTDGTEAGTTLVKDINPTGNAL